MKTKTLALLLSIVMLAAVSHADTSGSLMGTVKAISASSITVETMDKAPKPVTIAILPSTKFIKDGTVTSVKDLKVEDRVVVSIKPNGDKVDAVTVVFGQVFQHMDMHHKWGLAVVAQRYMRSESDAEFYSYSVGGHHSTEPFPGAQDNGGSLKMINGWMGGGMWIYTVIGVLVVVLLVVAINKMSQK